MATRRVRRHRRRTVKGGGYSFGGSILNASDSGGGNPLWNSNTGPPGGDCGVDANRAGNGRFEGGKRSRRRHRGGADVKVEMPGEVAGVHDSYNRGGQNLEHSSPMGGRRRQSRKVRKGRKGRSLKGGAMALNPRDTQMNPNLVQMSPRTGWSFNGNGVGGTADTIPY